MTTNDSLTYFRKCWKPCRKKKTKKKTSAQKHYIMLIIKLYRINLCKTMSRKDEIFFKHDMPFKYKKYST